MAAHQRAGEVIAGVASARIQQNTGERRLIISKGLRAVDDLDKVGDDVAPDGIKVELPTP